MALVGQNYGQSNHYNVLSNLHKTEGDSVADVPLSLQKIITHK